MAVLYACHLRRGMSQTANGELVLPTTQTYFFGDEERRATLCAELDGLCAHLCALERDEMAYILYTFPIVRRKDEEEPWEYRTKRMVLRACGRLESLTR